VANHTITAIRNAPAIARTTLEVLSKLEGEGIRSESVAITIIQPV